jgi:murein DD-endopeptidase MepM/ murein hydrolase activator NlpD
MTHPKSVKKIFLVSAAIICFFSVAITQLMNSRLSAGTAAPEVLPISFEYNQNRNQEDADGALTRSYIDGLVNDSLEPGTAAEGETPVGTAAEGENPASTPAEAPKTFIKWIDFKVPAALLDRAAEAHRALHNAGKTDYGACELLAYLALKCGNSFSIKRDTALLNKLVKEIEGGSTESIAKYKDHKYYKYYTESFHAGLDGIIGADGTVNAYGPIAKGFWYSDFDDFGDSRGYGFRRRHLGHDMFGSTGSPIIAVEGGTITEFGWNQYGGWRVGIRSDDTKRYYYYAHLRKGRPYPEGLKLGDRVSAGQVIGYLGATGYSRKPDTNMSARPHLHFGLQIIFDKSQEDGNGEIWVDVHQIVRFLSKNRMKVIKNSETKEYTAERIDPLSMRE